MTEARSSSLCLLGSGHWVTLDIAKGDDGSAVSHLSGVARCGSPWSCPVCAPVVREFRAGEVNQAIAEATRRGYGVYFVTVTVRHHRGDDLAGRLDAIAKSMRLILNGEPWQRRKAALGYLGGIKAVEVLDGRHGNGWHPHAHMALIFKRELLDAEQLDLRDWMHQRWASVCERNGFGTINAHGVDLRPVTRGGLGDYLTKIEGGWTVGHELLRGDAKVNQSKLLTPFEILAEFVATGDGAPLARWVEYDRATYGKRSLVWSRGLRALLLGSEVEAKDEDVATVEGEGLTLLRALIETPRWNRLVGLGEAAALQTEVENVASLLFWIAEWSGFELVPIDAPQLRERLTT